MSTELALVWLAFGASGVANFLFMRCAMRRQDDYDALLDLHSERGTLHAARLNAQHDWLLRLNNELQAHTDRLMKLEGIKTEGP